MCKIQCVNGSASRTSWTDQLDGPAGRTSWTDQLDGPAGRTNWTDQLDGPAGRTSWIDQFSLFEALASLHIQRLTFQFVRCRSFRVRPRPCLSFACCQATWDTSLEYPQGVLWRQKYFHFPRGHGILFGQNRKPKWPKNTFLALESYYLHINTWNFTRSGTRKEILDFSLRLCSGTQSQLFSNKIITDPPPDRHMSKLHFYKKFGYITLIPLPFQMMSKAP